MSTNLVYARAFSKSRTDILSGLFSCRVLTVLFILSSLVVSAQVLELGIRHGLIPGYGYSIYTRLSLGGRDIWAVVDTGSPWTSFVGKDWYERELGLGACQRFWFGCYSCPEPCHRGPTSVITYTDKTTSLVFLHRDLVKLGTTTVAGLEFGVQFQQDPPPRNKMPTNLVGLSPHRTKAYDTLIGQLMNKSIIHSNTFAVYLLPNVRDGWRLGKLFIGGGGDPSLYKHPLHYVKLSSQNEYMVILKNINIGGALTIIGINNGVLFDTGTNSIYVPAKSALLASLLREISKLANVTFQWMDVVKAWRFSCTRRTSLPTLTFELGAGNAPLKMTHVNYVRHVHGDICFLIFRETEKEFFILPAETFIGNYVEFRPRERRLGVAELA